MYTNYVVEVANEVCKVEVKGKLTEEINDQTAIA